MDVNAAGPGRRDRTRRRPVVVGVDGSSCAESALRYAMEAAARRGANFEVISSFARELYWIGGAPIQIPDTEAIRADTESRARDMVERVRTELATGPMAVAGDIATRIIAAAGPAGAVLTDHARDAELLVVGNRGRGAVRSGVLGSVALHCAMHSPCPVMVVHPTPNPTTDVVAEQTDPATVDR